MTPIIRAFVACFLLALSFAAQAGTCYRTVGSALPSDYGSYGSAAAACGAWRAASLAQRQANQPGYTWALTDNGSTSTSCGAILTRNGVVFDYPSVGVATFECEEICPAGQAKTFMPTTGWGWVKGFASDGRAMVEGAPGRVAGDGNSGPAELCDGACLFEVDGAPTDFFVSKEPGSSGMHRISVFQNYKGKGQQCTVVDKSPELDNHISPSCPGAQGEVNGKTVCIAQQGGQGAGIAGKTVGTGTTSQSVTGTPTASIDGSGNPEKIGPNGEVPGKSTDVPSGSGGGSTSGTSPSQSTPGGSSSLPSSGSNTTTKFGPIDSPATPGVPVLYERKYQGSVASYFQTQMSAASGPLTNMASSLFPTWVDTPGACPQFSVPLSLGFWDYGQFDTNIPCGVWALCRIVVIISALFLARALVFGG